MREIIGFHAGDSILAPGGSISNMYALIIARHRLFPQHKHEGMRAIHEHLVVYTSEEVNAVLFIGLMSIWFFSNLTFSNDTLIIFCLIYFLFSVIIPYEEDVLRLV